MFFPVLFSKVSLLLFIAVFFLEFLFTYFFGPNSAELNRVFFDFVERFSSRWFHDLPPIPSPSSSNFFFEERAIV